MGQFVMKEALQPGIGRKPVGTQRHDALPGAIDIAIQFGALVILAARLAEGQ